MISSNLSILISHDSHAIGDAVVFFLLKLQLNWLISFGEKIFFLNLTPPPPHPFRPHANLGHDLNKLNSPPPENASKQVLSYSGQIVYWKKIFEKYQQIFNNF